MPRLMVDASAWIALYHGRDAHHDEALDLFPDLREAHPLWTTEPFAFEAHKRLAQDARAGRHAARDFARDLAAGSLAALVPPDAMPPFGRVAEAWRGLPALSLEDVSGALTMRALGMRAIWAWDEDFRRLGFEVLP
ncbi:MAG: type II toxin-antitoxin system VapC family toxin [Halobacteriales archaeon]|nr:type II toxin-antitoxin system VapC family toxin [Halobacteriales archaeon]